MKKFLDFLTYTIAFIITNLFALGIIYFVEEVIKKNSGAIINFDITPFSLILMPIIGFGLLFLIQRLRGNVQPWIFILMFSIETITFLFSMLNRIGYQELTTKNITALLTFPLLIVGILLFISKSVRSAFIKDKNHREVDIS
ncbi:hypothetical protein OO013_07330 [Mangrovivirga sp. M17]|uniref:DUF4293 family protein n=1 Tax=Mangrovivirga halotolerans TaxID=2993936 RepID=A0ABT3RPY7_9BACT|nr:hypothetical protein [Mangrovivirga halotolerans]MCX2743670.1 hypothetical protein [Mangrovivirga halotolerans]